MTDEEKTEAVQLLSTVADGLADFERTVERSMRMCSSEPAETVRDLSRALLLLARKLRDFVGDVQIVLEDYPEVSDD